MGKNQVSLEQIIKGRRLPLDVAMQVNAEVTLEELRNTGVDDKYLYSVTAAILGRTDQFLVIFKPGQSKPGLEYAFAERFRVLKDLARAAVGHNPSYSQARIDLIYTACLPSPVYNDKLPEVIKFRNVEARVAQVAGSKPVTGHLVNVDSLNKRAGGYHTAIKAKIPLNYQLTQAKIAELGEKMGNDLGLKSVTVNYYRVPVDELRVSNLPPKKTRIQNSGIFIF